NEKPEHYPHWHEPEYEGEVALVRRMPLRPGRFTVGLGDAQRGMKPPRDRVKTRGTPLSAAAYVGRVEEVAADGEVTVRVWARPSGGEGLTTLDAWGGAFDREPSPGDLLWIWTWTDIWREHGEVRRAERVHVEVERRELDEGERARIRTLLAELREV